MYTDIETLYNTTIEKNPTCWMAHNNLGIVLKEKGRLPEAIDHCRQALRIDPDRPEAHVNLAIALMAQGKVEEAVDHYNEALRIEPDYAPAHYNLGLHLKRNGLLNEAVPHFEAVVRIWPEDADAQLNLGTTYLGLERLQDAERQLSAALRLRGRKNAEFTHFNLAIVCRRLGRLDEAVDQLIDGLQINPNVDAARRELTGVLLARVDSYVEAGQLPQAAEFVRAKREWANLAGGPELLDALNAKLLTPAPATAPALPASQPTAP